MNESAIVLCGGRSSRMGRDKATLPFGDESLLERTRRLAGEVASDVVTVGGPAQLDTTAPGMIGDPGAGPLVALAVGLRHVRHARALLIACDMPLVRPALLGRLFELSGEYDACVPRIGGTPMPTCAVYARRIAPDVQARVDCGDRSLRALLDGLSVRWVEADELRLADPDLESFIDCDTPEDYARALALAGLSG